MLYKALDIAGHFIKISNDKDILITSDTLQKLLYFTQVWHYTFYDEPFLVEDFEAWVHGPTIPKVFEHYKHFHFRGVGIPYDPESKLVKLTKDNLSFLKNVWDVYGRCSVFEFRILVHNDPAWEEARKGFDIAERCNAIIDMQTAKVFYEKRIKPI